jgi:hypothetical protein
MATQTIAFALLSLVLFNFAHPDVIGLMVCLLSEEHILRQQYKSDSGLTVSTGQIPGSEVTRATEARRVPNK